MNTNVLGTQNLLNVAKDKNIPLSVDKPKNKIIASTREACIVLDKDDNKLPIFNN